jgi:hypothetical protein
MKYIAEIIFSKQHFSLNEAKQWVRKNKFKPKFIQNKEIIYKFVLINVKKENYISIYEEADYGVTFCLIIPNEIK